jgi:hypothetical protein
MLYATKYYWPGVTRAGLEQVAERARAGLGAGSGSVIYLGSLLFATDDLVLCLLQCPTRASSSWPATGSAPVRTPHGTIWLPSDPPIPEGAQR